MTISTMRMTGLPLQTIGGQLAMMDELLARATDVTSINNHWNSIYVLCHQHGMSKDRLGEKPEIDDAVPAFMRRFCDVMRPNLSRSIIALSECPTAAVLNWQQLNPDDVSRYGAKGIISTDAAKKLITATEKQAIEMTKARNHFTLGERIDVLSKYMDLPHPHPAELVSDMKIVLTVYGLSTSVLTVPRMIKSYEVVAYRMRLLEKIQSRIKNEIMQYVINLPPGATLDQIGLNEKVLIKASELGLLTEQEFGHINGLMVKLTRLTDVLAKRGMTKNELERATVTYAHTKWVSTKLVAGAVVANAGAAAYLFSTSSISSAIPLVANAIVFGLALLVTRGIVFGHRKSKLVEPETFESAKATSLVKPSSSKNPRQLATTVIDAHEED